MIETEIIDRVPLYPGRITLDPVEGKENTWDMKRADEPTVPGTPLNKATFESFIHSRLTGRYYEMEATKTVLSTAEGTTTPVPTSWNDVTTTAANSGGYSISASGSADSSVTPDRAFDGVTGTSWRSSSGTTAWLRLDLPSGITVNKMKIAFIQRESYSTTTMLQGLNTSGTWTNLLTISQPSSTSLIEYTISNPTDYKAYRLYFTFSATADITVYEWQISSWKTATYRYNYSITEGVPATWTSGQKITVLVPDSSTAGVTENTLNGVTVNTILQPNKRYELVYNGTAFDAKEV